MSFEPKDAEGMYLLNADPEVMKFTGDLPFDSIEGAAAFIRDYDAYHKTGMGRWAMDRREDGAFLGWCGLKQHQQGIVDLGYRIMSKYWGRGYATEAARLSLWFGFERLGMEQVIARTHRDNHASIRVAEKLKMDYWGKEWVEGLGEANIYGMTGGKWKRIKKEGPC